MYVLCIPWLFSNLGITQTRKCGILIALLLSKSMHSTLRDTSWMDNEHRHVPCSELQRIALGLFKLLQHLLQKTALL